MNNKLVELLCSLRDRFPSGGAYAGIGSRETPSMICEQMRLAAVWLEDHKFVLRSGAADGADSAFRNGARHAEEFLPWKGFNRSSSPLFVIPEKAFTIAAEHHPRWPHMSQAVRKLMARNVQQVLGADLKSPSCFVLCWTKDNADGMRIKTGKDTGGTGQAIRIAVANGIPVFNFRSIFPSDTIKCSSMRI